MIVYGIAPVNLSVIRQPLIYIDTLGGSRLIEDVELNSKVANQMMDLPQIVRCGLSENLYLMWSCYTP